MHIGLVGSLDLAAEAWWLSNLVTPVLQSDAKSVLSAPIIVVQNSFPESTKGLSGFNKPAAELIRRSFWAVSVSRRAGRKYKKSLGDDSGNHRLRS